MLVQSHEEMLLDEVKNDKRYVRVFLGTEVANTGSIDSLEEQVTYKYDEYTFSEFDSSEYVDGRMTKVIKASKINEADKYLFDTDWVESYLTNHISEIVLIPLDSNKWVIINKREEYKTFLRSL